MHAVLLASALWAGVLLPVSDWTDDPAEVPFARRAVDTYEAALLTSLDTFRLGGRDRVIAEVEACYAKLGDKRSALGRVQFCYLMGDAATEILRRSGDALALPPALHEPARREQTLTQLARLGIGRPGSDVVLTTWGALGRQALKLHEADLPNPKAAETVPASPTGPESTEPTKDAR